MTTYKLLFSIFIFAFCSISYELLLAQVISLRLGGVKFIYPIVIGVYICFLGIGSLIYEKLLNFNKFHLLLIVESLLMIISLAGFYLFSSLDSFIHISAFLWVCAIALLSGLELPILIDMDKKQIQNLLSSDYIGSFFGTVFFAYGLSAYFSVENSFIILISLNFVGCIPIITLLAKGRNEEIKQ